MALVDFAIATEAMEHFSNLILLPCYHWNRSVVVPKNHPLTLLPKLTLEAIAELPACHLCLWFYRTLTA
jgi:LysR family cys regulon transcriptional activator